MNPETTTEKTETADKPSKPAKKESPKERDRLFGAEGRGDLLRYKPENLVIVTDPKHFLYDARVKEPVTDSFVRQILKEGVLEPVLIRKNPENGDIEVVAGRKRVRAAIEANKRLKENGEEPMLVPCVMQRAKDETQLLGIVVMENEGRHEDSILNKLHKMQRLMARGLGEKELAVYFNVSTQSIKNYIALLEATPEVRKAADDDKITAAQAYELAKMKPELQKEKLAAMLDAVKDDTGTPGKRRKRGRARKMREAAGGGAAPTKREIRWYLEKLQDDSTDPNVRAVLEPVLLWILGERGAKPQIPKAKAVA